MVLVRPSSCTTNRPELEIQEVKHGVKGVQTLLHTLGMVRKIRLWGESEPVYYRSSWVRANRGGILLSDVVLGRTVRDSTKLFSPHSGRIIGMARNQVVMPGFAAFHIGIEAAEVPTDESGDELNLHDSDIKDSLSE